MISTEFEFLDRLVQDRFGLPAVRSLIPASAGTVNRTWRLALVDGGRWILRCYGPESRPERIAFEHALLSALGDRNYREAPMPLAATGGDTLVKAPDAIRHGLPSPFFAVFSFIAGESAYDWNRPGCGPERARNAGAALARYHRAVYGWRFQGAWREPDALRRLPDMLRRWRDYGTEPPVTEFDRGFHAHLERHRAGLFRIEETLARFSLDGLPRLAIHGDYHPGNVVFQGDGVAGILDFDWARMDFRLTDVALALRYFSASWDASAPPIHEPTMDRFLTGYQADWPARHPLPCLTDVEREALPLWMTICNGFIMDWIVAEVRAHRQSAETALPWLRHARRVADMLAAMTHH